MKTRDCPAIEVNPLAATACLCGEKGSALVAGLVTLAVLSMVAAATFQTVTSRFRSNYQTASWHDALTAAESGVQYSLARLRSPLTTSGVLTDPLNVPGSLQSDLATLTAGGASNNGTVLSDTYNGVSFPRIQLPTLTIPHLGQGSSQYVFTTTVDAVPQTSIANSGLNTWYRIRSVGVVPLSGSANVGVQKYDNLLRKLQFRKDSSGAPLTTPQAMRTIEVLAKPVTTGSSALFGQTGINLNNQNIVINSYDSRSPLTSTNGLYDQAKATQSANVVTDDNLQGNGLPGVINLSPTGAYVNGNVATNNTPVTGSTGHVSGTVTQDFYQALPETPNPATVSNSWSSFSPASSTMATGTLAAPTRYKIGSSGSLSLTGNSTLNFTAPASGEGYVEVWIPGDLTVSGNGGIVMPPHVHATFYVDGNVKISGNGIQNTSLYPVNLTLYGNHDPSVVQTMTVDGNGQFAGLIYAPNAAVSAKGGGSSGDIYGAIVANTIFFNGQTSLHYDTALGDHGAVIDYRIASWYEDNTLTR
jgi:Tfp pilus assembly protein PilX